MSLCEPLGMFECHYVFSFRMRFHPCHELHPGGVEVEALFSALLLSLLLAPSRHHSDAAARRQTHRRPRLSSKVPRWASLIVLEAILRPLPVSALPIPLPPKRSCLTGSYPSHEFGSD